MKRILLASAVVLVAAVGGGGYYVLASRDPLQQAKALLSKGDYAGASLQLRSAVRDEPNNAEAHYLLAQIRLGSGDGIAAEREVKQAMALHWDRSTSLALLAQAYVLQKKWKEILAEIPDKGPSQEQTAYFLMSRAIAQHGLNDPAQANATLAQAERLAPQNAQVHVVAAEFAAGANNAAEALKQIDQALALEPNRIDALKVKAGLLAAKGDRAGAIAELDKAVKAAPNSNELLLLRAGLLMAQNEDAKAAADVDAALKRDPKFYPAIYVKSVLLIRQGKFAEADLQLQQIDQFLGQFQRGLYFKAMVKSRIGQNGQAEDAIMSYVARFPGDADAIRLLAAIELTTNHANRAIPYLVRAVAAGQRDTETLDLLGRAYAADGKKQQAEDAFRQAADSAKTPQQLTRLASARLQIGDLSGAQSDLQRSVDSGSQPGAAEALIATSIRLGQFDRAQEALDKLRAQAGETEAVGNLTGLLKLAQLDTAGALAAFSDTAKRFPDAVGPKLNEAKVLLQLNRRDEAVPLLQSILEKTPTQPDALSLLSQTLLASGKGEEALAAADRARKAKPDDLGLINGEAQLYARLGQPDKAIALLNGTQVDGKIPTVLLPTLGTIQFAAGQTDSAKQTFAALVAAEPNNLGAILTNVEVLLRLKDYNGARALLDDALRRQPGILPLLQARVRIDLIDKGPDGALATADRLRADQANMPAAALLKGGVLMGTQRYREATTAFQSEYDKDATSQLAVALFEAKQAAGDKAGARTVLQNWLGTHPDDPAAAQGLATLDIADGNNDAAERNLTIVLKAQPNNLIALNNMAWVLHLKHDKRAREYAQRAFEQAPTPEVVDTLAWIMTSEGDAAKALPLLQGATRAAPQNAAIKYHLAVALKDLNRPQEAIDVLRPLLESTATFDDRAAAATLLADLTKAKP